MASGPLIVTTPEQLQEMIRAAVRDEVSRLTAQDRPLKLEDVAELLDVCPKTVSTMVRLEGLPAKRVGRQLRFFRRDVLEWLARQEAA